MPKTRPPYSPGFRRQMVELVRAGRDPAELAREFEPTAQSICHWVAQADRQEGRQEEKGNGLSAAEREELARLRRENKELRLERDILSRAAAWFARETGAIRTVSKSTSLSRWRCGTSRASISADIGREAGLRNSVLHSTLCCIFDIRYFIKRSLRVTPAMEARVSDRLWSLDELVERTSD